MKVHFVSQVLLKRFTINSELRVHSKRFSPSIIRFPEHVAFAELPTDIFAPIDQKYSYTETRAATAYQSLYNGTLFEHPKDIESFKKLIVVHLVRSAAMIETFAHYGKDTFEKFITETSKESPDLKAEYNENNKFYEQVWLTKLMPLLPKVIKPLLRKSEEFVFGQDIQIGMAPKGLNFVVSDVPVLNKSLTDLYGLGYLGNDEHTDGFVMPLSPYHVVASVNHNPDKSYFLFEKKHVAELNSKFIKQAFAEFYTLP